MRLFVMIWVTRGSDPKEIIAALNKLPAVKSSSTNRSGPQDILVLIEVPNFDGIAVAVDSIKQTQGVLHASAGALLPEEENSTGEEVRTYAK